jgi:E3 ubiquitin-protein ligase DOA10
VIADGEGEGGDEQGAECRICLMDAGPFCSPCRCTGTLKYVHVGCLGHWQGLTLVHFSAHREPYLVTEATASFHISA